MRNIDVMLLTLDMITLELKKGTIFFRYTFENIAGAFASAMEIKISEPETMVEDTFKRLKETGETVIGIYLPARTRRKRSITSNREEIAPKLREFFEEFVQGREKFKKRKLTETELKILKTEGVDFYDPSLSVMGKSIKERVNVFVKRARMLMEDGIPLAYDLLDYALLLDPENNVAQKLRARPRAT